MTDIPSAALCVLVWGLPAASLAVAAVFAFAAYGGAGALSAAVAGLALAAAWLTRPWAPPDR